MSDMLEKLLDAEKGATGLVSQAEAEAGQKVARLRAELQKTHTELLKRKAIESDAAVKVEKERVATERDQKNKEYRDKLARQPTDPDAFRTTVLSLIE